MWKCEKCWTFRWVSFQSFRVRLRFDDSDDIGRAHDDKDNDVIWRMNIFVPQWGKLLRKCYRTNSHSYFFLNFGYSTKRLNVRLSERFPRFGLLKVWKKCYIYTINWSIVHLCRPVEYWYVLVANISMPLQMSNWNAVAAQSFYK